jgi:aminoglycoside 6'-N-acetyltransferase
VAPNQRAIDIWIGEEEYIAKGFGSTMMRFAINHCFAQSDVKSILIDPLANNLRAHKFYKRLGFEFVERRQFDEESDCFVFRLNRENWESSPTFTGEYDQ